MAVEVKAAQIRTTGRVVTSLFPNFLDRGLRYQVDEVLPGPPVAQEWHQHEAEEVLIPLRGSFRLEYRDGGSAVAARILPTGSRHAVPPGLAHRLVTSGGLVESFRSGGTGGTGGTDGEDWSEEAEGGSS